MIMEVIEWFLASAPLSGSLSYIITKTSTHLIYSCQKPNQSLYNNSFSTLFRTNIYGLLSLRQKILPTKFLSMDIPSNGHVKVEPSDISHEEIEPLTTEPASRALSDGSHNDTPTPTYKHKWTVEQRLTLTMLAESYSNKWNEMTAVFNHFHKSDLRRCGGLRKEVVNAQWNDMRAKNFDAAAALSKLQATLSPYDRLKLISRAELKKKADEVGVKLKAKGPTNSNPSSLSRKRKRADFNEDRRTDFLPDRSDIEHDLPIFPKTPVKTNARKLDNGLLTPPDTRGPKRQCLTAEKKMAQIGFRAFTAQSQGTYCPVLGIRGKPLAICSRAFYFMD